MSAAAANATGRTRIPISFINVAQIRCAGLGPNAQNKVDRSHAMKTPRRRFCAFHQCAGERLKSARRLPQTRAEPPVGLD